MRKKSCILLLFFLVNNLLFSQKKDTIYYDEKWKETKKKSALYYRPMPLLKLGNLELLRDYHKNGQLQMQAYIADGVERKFVGDVYWMDSDGEISSMSSYINPTQKELTYYFDDGSIWKEVQYQDSIKHGTTTEYKKDSSLLGKCLYQEGYIIGGVCGMVGNDISNYNSYDDVTKSSVYKNISTNKVFDYEYIKIAYWKNTLQIAVEKFYKNGILYRIKEYDESGNLLHELTEKDYFTPFQRLKNGKVYDYDLSYANEVLHRTYVEYRSFPYSEVKADFIHYIIAYRGALYLLQKHPTENTYRKIPYDRFIDNNQKVIQLTIKERDDYKPIEEYLNEETQLVDIKDITPLSKEEIINQLSTKKWENTTLKNTPYKEYIQFSSNNYTQKVFIDTQTNKQTTEEEHSAIMYFKVGVNQYIIVREKGGFFIPYKNNWLIQLPSKYSETH